MTDGARLPAELARRLAHWASLWMLPGLESRVTVTFSPRLRRALGRCVPSRAEIRLNARLLSAAPRVVEETLCHELAHVAAFELHGHRARPHGREWAALMRAAGYEPRARAAFSEEIAGVIGRPNRHRFVYEHRCPVCHAMRLARRPFRRWRCMACVRSGLSGRLVIARRDSQSGDRRLLVPGGG